MVRNAGVKNWSEEELERLLEIVEMELPLGDNGWVKVAELYQTNLPALLPNRDVKSMVRAFNKQVNTPKPTGRFGLTQVPAGSPR
jgi:hypothetical protein